MAHEDTFRRIFNLMQNLLDRVLDLESEHGEVHGFHFGNAFPSNAYPNQIIVRTDITPPVGGTMFRYDSGSNSWLQIN